MNSKSILILGAKGMLGQALVRAFNDGDEYTVTAWDKEELDPEKSQSDLGAGLAYEKVDITNEKIVREKIMALWPDVIVNATAYNAVDACEESDEEYAKAQKLNADVPGLLADIANDLQAVIVHYSTDYVFNGEKPQYKEQGKRAPGCCGSGCVGCNYNDPSGNFSGYKEHDLPNPLSRYGKTKLEGEKLVAKNCPDNHYIIRLSKLFGKPGAAEGAKQSFFDVILKKGHDILRQSASDRRESAASLRAVDGEVSCFTYAPDLAQKTREIVEGGFSPGVYHVTNSGAVTWYEAAKKLFDIAGLDVKVDPVSPDAFPRPAKRPEKSTLLSSKIDPMRPWEDALEEYLNSQT